LDCKPHIAQLYATRTQTQVVKPDFKLNPGQRLHNYDTRHLKQANNLYYLQECMGLKILKTTEICTHVTEKSMAKIKSPFDDL